MGRSPEGLLAGRKVSGKGRSLRIRDLLLNPSSPAHQLWCDLRGKLINLS